MLYIGVIISLLGILAFFILISLIQALIKISERRKNNNENKLPEELFFEQVSKGEKAQKIINASDEIEWRQMDIMMIKSLLQSEQIPFYVEFNYSSGIYPGLQIGSLGSQNLYVLEKDHEDAMNIIDDYMKNRV
ncbi:MAG: DUF2007 domain-containing protein [Treponema sp.]|nr:DUF2007 domain-containing protein [Treponema sp.]